LERLRGASLPEGIAQVSADGYSYREVYRILSTERNGSDDATHLARLGRAPQLLRVAGVADVVSYGGLLKRSMSNLIPRNGRARCWAHEFLMRSESKRQCHRGYVERGSEMFVIRSLGIFKNMSDIQAVRVAYHEVCPFELKMSLVSIGYAPDKASSPR